MRKRLLVVAVAFAVSVGVWGTFATSRADELCGSSCGLVCGNRCQGSCSGDCSIQDCQRSADACCAELWAKEGATPPCNN
jgi:hypothetical protein